MWRPLGYLFGFTCILGSASLLSYFVIVNFNLSPAVLHADVFADNTHVRNVHNFAQLHSMPLESYLQFTLQMTREADEHNDNAHSSRTDLSFTTDQMETDIG